MKMPRLPVILTLAWLVALPAVQAAQLSESSITINSGDTKDVAVKAVRGTVTLLDNYDTRVVSAKLVNDPRVGYLQIKGLAAGATSVKIRDTWSTRGKTKSSTSTLKVKVRRSETPPMTVSPSSLSLTQGTSGTVVVSNPSGQVTLAVNNPSIITASLAGNVIGISGRAAGSTNLLVSDARTRINVPITVTTSSLPPTPPPVTSGSYSLIAWNDLGMHCMDGKDFSVFSILPPYNNLHAQLINRTSGGNKLVTSGVTLTYESFMDAAGSINTSSADKTNFWDWVFPLFGASPAPDHGLNLTPGGPSNPMASPVPAPLSYNSVQGWWEAEGIPITPYDDAGNKNFYPMVQVVARDAANNVLASTRVVLPVSDEMSCKSCHASNSSPAARPSAGWLNDRDPEKDWKKNILRLHDEKFPRAIVDAGMSSTYTQGSLLASADNREPTLCAACHKSNALGTPAKPGIKPLTEALHSKHATVNDPVKNIPLDDISNRESCYLCHPGSVTKCLRGAMGNAPGIDCQSCHGNLSTVGHPGREGWLEQPNCQSCHDRDPVTHAFTRYNSVFSSGNTPRQIQDTTGRFATNPNTPANGVSLYRFSKGHGGLQCEACHGSTHAIYPSSHDNDNVQSLELQGHTGTIAECSTCHTTVPTTTSGGPHGLHTVGQAWVSESAHGKAAERNRTDCATCHGADYRGSPLSRASAARSLRVEGRTKSFAAGHEFGCYDCHNGPGGGD